MIAALYDIHGNLPALEAVLDEIRGLNINRIVVGGDIVPGPMPRETLERLRHLNIPVHFIYGNGEIAVLDDLAGRKAAVPEQHRAAITWSARQVESQQKELAAWPPTTRVEIPGLGDVLFCHATPRNENELFTRLTPEARLLSIFENAGAPVVVCGHTHMQFDRMVGSTRVINAGSVGMPFGAPGAHWLLLGPGVQSRRTEYDLSSAAEIVRSTDYPEAHDFANNILHPPSEAHMLDLFTRAEEKR